MGEYPNFPETEDHTHVPPKEMVAAQERLKPALIVFAVLPILSVGTGLFSNAETPEHYVFAGIITAALGVGTALGQHEYAIQTPRMTPEARSVAAAGWAALLVGCAVVSVGLGTMSLGSHSAIIAERSDQVRKVTQAVDDFIASDTALFNLTPKLNERGALALELSEAEAAKGAMCGRGSGHGICTKSLKEVGERSMLAAKNISKSQERNGLRASQLAIWIDDIDAAKANQALAHQERNALIDDRINSIVELLKEGRAELSSAHAFEAAAALRPEWLARGFSPESVEQLKARFKAVGEEAAKTAAFVQRSSETPLPKTGNLKPAELFTKQPGAFLPVGFALLFCESILLLAGAVFHAQAAGADKLKSERKAQRTFLRWAGDRDQPKKTKSPMSADVE